MQEPSLAAVQEDDSAENVKERRKWSSRKPVRTLSPLLVSQVDGVISSFKSTNCNHVMFEYQSSSKSDRFAVTPK